MGVRIQELPETTGINKEDVLIVEDGQGTKKGTVQQLDETLGVSQLKEDLLNVVNNKSVLLSLGNFQHYGLNTDGSFLTSQKYRVSNDDPIAFDRDILVSVDSGFKWGYIPFVDGVAGTWSGWKTEPHQLDKNTPIVFQIARVTENYSEIANVNEFVSAIHYTTIIDDIEKEIIKSKYDLYDVANFNLESGTINEIGYDVVDEKRCRTSEFIPIENFGDIYRKKIKFKFGIHYYSSNSNSSHIGNTSWINENEYTPTLPDNCKFVRLVFSFINDSNITTEDLSDSFYIKKALKKLIDDNTRKILEIDDILSIGKTHQYIGPRIPSNVYSFDSKKLFTMSYDGQTNTSQDIETYGDYLFVAFSGVEHIRIYSLTDNSLIATIVVETIHGSSMQFSNEFYQSDDEFPLLYVGGWNTNKINVIRIYRDGDVWSADVVRTLIIPTEYGYYASPSIDITNNYLVVYAHSNVSIPNNDDMVISIFDLSTLTTNDDGTYTPKFISKCFSPSIGTFQGHKYYGGKLYLTSTNSISPYKPRICSVDCGSGNIETRIDVSMITKSETEGLCYKIDGTKILWYITDYYNVFKLQF